MDLLVESELALVSDAGMPGLSDPGFALIKEAIRHGISITVLPGPSAITSALPMSGLPIDQFTYVGFLPRRASPRAASCPIIDGDLLFLTYDGVDQQFVAALEKETGETRWLTKRTYKSDQVPIKSKPNDNRKSYATPTVIEYNGKKQLISTAAEATYSYDSATGKA